MARLERRILGLGQQWVDDDRVGGETILYCDPHLPRIGDFEVRQEFLTSCIDNRQFPVCQTPAGGSREDHPLTAERKDAWNFDQLGLPSVRHREGPLELESGAPPRSSFPLRADVNGDGLEDVVSIERSD